MVYICENCGIEHKGSYGSGRFCSSKCARGFSTKQKRKEINAKVSKKLKKSDEPYIKICPVCKEKFRANKKRQICCSRNCSSRNMSVETKNKIRQKMIGVNAGDKNGMYGKSPKNTKNIEVYSEKHLHQKHLKVRSTFEKRFIDELNNDIKVINFIYEPKKFKVKYIDENGVKRTYQPDFLVNENKIVEIKNKWNVTLEETRIKEDAFRKSFNVDYEIKTY